MNSGDIDIFQSTIASASGRIAVERPDGDGVKLRGVTKQFRVGGRTLAVLSHFDLNIRPGEFLCIVGGSGCGKSTLLRLIAGLEIAETGDVTVGQKRITAPGPDRGIVFQEPRLLPWLTVWQNIAFGQQTAPAETRRQAVADIIRLVGLKGFESALPGQLSGGMAQRVGLARALVNRPKVLLLDEPLGALDALTRLQLQREILRIHQAEGSTTILVTHDIDEALQLGDRVVILARPPLGLRRLFEVPLPHPREPGHPELAELRRAILDVIFESDPSSPC